MEIAHGAASMSRLVWICVQAVFIGGLAYAVFLDHPDKPMELAFAAFGAVVLCAFLTAALTRVWDSARFQPSRAILWLVSIFGVSGAITAATRIFGTIGELWPLLFIMTTLAVALVSPIAVSVFQSLFPKVGQSRREHRRFGAAGDGRSQSLEHQSRVGISEDAR